MVLGPLGSADCNLCVWEGGGTCPASLEPAEPVQLRESQPGGAFGALCSEGRAMQQQGCLSLSL